MVAVDLGISEGEKETRGRGREKGNGATVAPAGLNSKEGSKQEVACAKRMKA